MSKTQRGNSKAWGAIEALFDLVRQNKILSSILAALIGLLGFYLTPIKDIVFHRIWQEKASIEIIFDSDSVRVQDEIKMYISMTPRSPAAISEGYASLIYSPDKVTLINNQPPNFNTPKMEAPTILLNGKPILFIGNSSGEAEIGVEITTKYNKYRQTKKIIISNAIDASKKKPTARNFTGEWSIRLGDSHGVMMLTDKGGNIAGSYKLENNSQGLIKGIRDGGIFHATFFRSATTKWIINAKTKTSEGFLLIEGSAIAHEFNNKKWVSTHQADNFIATVMILDQ